MKKLNISDLKETPSVNKSRDCCTSCTGKWCADMSNMTEDELLGKCAYVTTQKLLSGKWPILILFNLRNGAIRFNEMQRLLPKITHATLSKQLKKMEQDGLIIRTDYSEVPPRVEYSLSDIGKKFLEILYQIGSWGLEYIEYTNTK